MSLTKVKLSPKVVLVLFVALTYLPFINQAFHIDDPFYLEVAENTLKKPFFPYDFPAQQQGLTAPDAASHSHLPLTSYYLALIKAISGSDQEWIYHLAFLIFPLLAALEFFDLAGAFVQSRLAVTLLLVGSPAFLVLSHTLMTDVPLLAFWILTLSRFLKIMEGKGMRRDWIALTLGLLAASFISLLSLGLILLMGASILIRRFSPAQTHLSDIHLRRLLLIFSLPLLLWTLWYLRAYLHYDRFVLVNTLLHMNKREAFSLDLIGLKFISLIVNLGGAFLFPLVFWYGFARHVATRIFLLIFLLSFVPFYMGFPWSQEWSWTHVLLFSLFLSTGLLILNKLLALFFNTAKNLTQNFELHQSFLLLWLLGIFAAYLLIFYSGSVRYALLALPPVILLWMNHLERRFRNPFSRRNLIWLAVFLTTSYSLAIATADYRFANLYRSSASELSSDYSQPDRTIWFAGEWGFKYYMTKHGAKSITRAQIGPRAGDIIVKPYQALPWVTLYDGPSYTQLLEQRQASVTGSVRILDFFSHAGFYSTGWGILPFSISTSDRWEWFNVYLVTQEYDGPIPEPETAW